MVEAPGLFTLVLKHRAIFASAIAAITTNTTAGRSTLEQSGSIVPVQQQTPADDCHADTPKQCEVAKVRHSRTRHSRPSRVKTRDTGSIPGRRDRETKCACRAPIGSGPPRPRATNLHRFGRQRRSPKLPRSHEPKNRPNRASTENCTALPQESQNRAANAFKPPKPVVRVASNHQGKRCEKFHVVPPTKRRACRRRRLPRSPPLCRRKSTSAS